MRRPIAAEMLGTKVKRSGLIYRASAIEAEIISATARAKPGVVVYFRSIWRAVAIRAVWSGNLAVADPLLRVPGAVVSDIGRLFLVTRDRSKQFSLVSHH